MIEYLYDAIRATADEDVVIAAVITDEAGNALSDDFHLGLYDNQEKIGEFEGVYTSAGVYEFTIPMAITSQLRGRFWYCICDDTHKSYCFKQPIYFV